MRFRLTREGRAFFLFTIGVGLAAVNTGNNLLYLMLALMLSLTLLSGVLSEQVLRGVTVERAYPERAFAGAPALFEITLRNHKRWWSSYSLEVEDVAEGAPAERRCYFLKVGPRAAQASRYPRVAARRGELRFVGFRLRTRYPFGLVEKIRFVPAPGVFLVYPSLAAAPEPLPAPAAEREGEAARRGGRGVEVTGLREWRRGDEGRDVHWRRTASLGRVVVRERHADAAAHVEVHLDPALDGADAAAAARFEQAVSRAAALVAAAVREGCSAEVVAGAARSPRVAPGAAPDPIHAFLARLEAEPAERPDDDASGPRRREALLARGAG